MNLVFYLLIHELRDMSIDLVLNHGLDLLNELAFDHLRQFGLKVGADEGINQGLNLQVVLRVDGLTYHNFQIVINLNVDLLFDHQLEFTHDILNDYLFYFSFKFFINKLLEFVDDFGLDQLNDQIIEFFLLNFNDQNFNNFS